MFDDLVQFDYVVEVGDDDVIGVESYEGSVALLCQLQEGLKGKASSIVLDEKQLSIFLSPAHDKIVFAERICAFLEAEGKVVTRLVTEPGAFDRTPAKAVQSFILAW